MNKNKLYMVPQVVIDCAENYATSKNPNSRAAYEARLVAIKEYCDYMLKQSAQYSISENYGKRSRK